MGNNRSSHHVHRTHTIIREEVDHSPVIQDLLRQMRELEDQIREYNRILAPAHHNNQVAIAANATRHTLRQLDLQLLNHIRERLQQRRESDSAERSRLEALIHSAPSIQDQLQFYQMIHEFEIQYPTSLEVLAWLKQACNIWAKPQEEAPNPQVPPGQPGNQDPPTPPGIQGA